MIRALADPTAGPGLRELLGRPLTPEERDRARELVRETGAAEAAIAEARRFAAQAAGALGALDPSPVVDGLSGLADHLLEPMSLT